MRAIEIRAKPGAPGTLITMQIASLVQPSVFEVVFLCTACLKSYRGAPGMELFLKFENHACYGREQQAA